ncbi:MAG: carboxypeptidase regulatory-like domain-containing protein [Anaerolineales bacterium]|nr:carboxypeptidase regulatory-like domain-containing protein [Anaerolineales bacterium]
MKTFKIILLPALALSLAAGCRIPQPVAELPTPTPTPVGTWEMVITGTVSDQRTGEPIPAALIRYLVIHSYFPEIQEGRSMETTTDRQGRFSLPMIVHDTDNIRLRVEAGGYQIYEEKLDLFGDRKLEIDLAPTAAMTGISEYIALLPYSPQKE